MWRKNPNFERYHLEQEEAVKFLRRAIPPIHLYKLNADGEGLVGYMYVLFRIFWGAKCLSRWEPREIVAAETPQLQRWKQLNEAPGQALWLSNVLVDIGELSNQCRKFLFQDATDGACVYVSDQFLRLFSSSIEELKQELLYELVDGTVVRVLRGDTGLVLAYFAIVKGAGIVEEHTLPRREHQVSL